MNSLQYSQCFERALVCEPRHTADTTLLQASLKRLAALMRLPVALVLLSAISPTALAVGVVSDVTTTPGLNSAVPLPPAGQASASQPQARRQPC